MSDLTTKAAEIRAGLVAELRLAERIFKEDAEDRAAYSTGCVFERAAALIEQQAAELAAKAEEDLAAEASLDMWRSRATTAESERDEARTALQVAKDGWRDAEAEVKKLSAERAWIENDGGKLQSERNELLREKERLGAALAPFAKAAEDCGVEDDIRIGVVKPADVIWESAAAASITFGHLEGARSALAPLGEE